MSKDPVISVTINDIISIYNTLLDHKETKWLPDALKNRSFNDPLFIMHDEIGGKKLALAYDENNPNIGTRKLNLRIKCRFLITTSKVIRCKHCTSPVIDTMVPDFEIRSEG